MEPRPFTDLLVDRYFSHHSTNVPKTKVASEAEELGCMGARWSSQQRSPKPKPEVVSRGISNLTQDKMSAASSSTPATVTAIVSNDNLKEVLRRAKEPNSKLLVLEFTAPWSEPCKFMRPLLEQIAARFKDYADFYLLDVEQFKTFARNTRVEALPTFLLVRTAVLDRVVGVSKDELERSVQKHTPPRTVPQPI